MTTAPPPPPPPQGNVEDCHFVTFILCLQFPIVLNHRTVGTASWQNHNSLLFYCTATVAYVYQTPTFLPHYGDNVKVKSQHICQAIPALLRGLGEAVVTNDWCIIYSLCCTSQPPPKNIMAPNTKYDIRWYIFQHIPKYIPTPSLVSLSNFNC